MNTSIVITNFNGRELLMKNLPKVLEAKENRKNNIKEIIIVDDASTDNSIKFLKDNFSRKIRVLANKTNLGFAGTTNIGVKYAKGDLVCLLNSDVIPQKNFLETMLKDFADPQVFAVSLHEEGFGPAKGKFVNGFIVHQGLPESKKVEDTFWASGGSGVYKRSIWRDLKGMDQVLMPFYWDDIDLCYRAQKRGYKILWDPNAKVVHQHESTYGKLNQKYVSNMKERNYLLFNWKNITSTNLMKKHNLALIKKLLSHPGYLKIFLLARREWKVLDERRKIELKETIVSDEAVFAKFN